MKRGAPESGPQARWAEEDDWWEALLMCVPVVQLFALRCCARWLCAFIAARRIVERRREFAPFFSLECWKEEAPELETWFDHESVDPQRLLSLRPLTFSAWTHSCAELQLLSHLTSLTALETYTEGFRAWRGGHDAALSSMTQLRRLDFIETRNDRLQTFAYLRALTALESLDLHLAPGDRHAPVGPLTGLTALSFSGHGALFFSSWSHLTQLRHATVLGALISAEPGLAAFTEMRDLTVRGHATTLQALNGAWLPPNATLSLRSFEAEHQEMLELLAGLDYTRSWEPGWE